MRYRIISIFLPHLICASEKRGAAQTRKRTTEYNGRMTGINTHDVISRDMTSYHVIPLYGYLISSKSYASYLIVNAVTGSDMLNLVFSI